MSHPIPGLPPGYSSRPIDPATDVGPVSALCNAASQAEDGIDELDEKVQEESYRAPTFDPLTDALYVGDAAGRPAATAEYWDNEESHVSPWLFARIHPDLVATPHGAAIGAAISGWADARAATTLALAAPDLRVTLTAEASAANLAMQRIWEAAGFQHVRSSWAMEIELAAEPPPPPTWPEGITVRSAIPGDAEFRAIHDVVNDAFADHYGFVEGSLTDFVHFSTQMTPFDPDLWRLATDGDEIAGISLNTPYRPGMPDVGWINTLGVRRPWRRRGIAEALLRDAFTLYHARGVRRVGLGVDASNLTGATRLYERVGMHVARESRQYEKRLREGRELRTMELAAKAG